MARHRHITHRIGQAAAACALLGTVVTAQDNGERRLTPAEVRQLPVQGAGAGTSGLAAVTTRVLFGDPTQAGPYAIELTVAPNTIVQPHSHRDTRTAVVVDGLWLFGYGSKNTPEGLKALAAGGFYTEPGGGAHYARTGSQGATVIITGFGPTDTVYGK